MVFCERMKEPQGVLVAQLVLSDDAFIGEINKSGVKEVVPHALHKLAAVCKDVVLEIGLSRRDAFNDFDNSLECKLG